jgi:hypothetical protein
MKPGDNNDLVTNPSAIQTFYELRKDIQSGIRRTLRTLPGRTAPPFQG